MFMKTDKYLYDCLILCQSKKKYIWNWSKIGIFHFFIRFFCGNINQEYKLLPLPLCVFGSFIWILWKLYVSLR